MSNHGLTGTVVRGVGGFYYVHAQGQVYECRARGRFRLDEISPLVGDQVVIAPDEGKTTGFVTEILPRKNLLTRPPCANVDRFVLVLSAHLPKADLLLADKLLLQAALQKVEPMICLNKCDLASPDEIDALAKDFRALGAPVLALSAKTGQGMSELAGQLAGKISCFAGQSAVGKSSLLNALAPQLALETGGLSKKTARGRHARKRRRAAVPRDEASELSQNYDTMLRTVGEQFTRIQEDRVRILQLLDSRQAFYNNVTHELKTPLTTIQGYAQLLEQAGAADGELFSRGLAHIQHESARLHRMVIQLLEMSDIDRGGSLEPMDAAAVLRSVAQSMALKAVRYGCAIRFDGEQSLPILGREERVRQLCINLIDNAIKYGAPGETIWAVADHSGSRASLRVINRGEGFTDEEAERLFEPFYRVDKEHSREMGSAGLGLSICKKIVEEHGGAIRARSRGGYTVFEVRLPLDKAKWEGGAPA